VPLRNYPSPSVTGQSHTYRANSVERSRRSCQRLMSRGMRPIVGCDPSRGGAHAGATPA
jgi:hypothetical protein